MDRVGIKTDDVNRIRVRGELIVGNMDGLVADLGGGFFVVTEEAHNDLIKLGIEMQEVEIKKGKPLSSVTMQSSSRRPTE